MFRALQIAFVVSYGVFSVGRLMALGVPWEVPDAHKKESCPQEEVFERAYVTKEFHLRGGKLMMYKEPTHLSEKVGSTPEGDKVKVLCKFGSQMFYVETQDKRLGWVSQFYIRRAQ